MSSRNRSIWAVFPQHILRPFFDEFRHRKNTEKKEENIFFMTRDKKTLRTSITRGTHYMAPSCNGHDVAVLPNNVGSGRVGPSHPPPALTSSSDVANALALLHAKIALHLMSHAALARACWGTGSDRALALASCLKKACVSSDHLPPTSPTSTTSLKEEKTKKRKTSQK